MKKYILKISVLIAVLAFLTAPFPALASSVSVGSARDITDYSAPLTGSYSIQDTEEPKATFWEYNTFDFKSADSGLNWDHADRISGTWTTTLSGLSPNTTYYYGFCFVRGGRNCVGNLSFTTLPLPPPPAVTAKIEEQDIQSKGAILRGTLASNWRPTSVWFEYGDSESLGYPTFQQTKGETYSGPIEQQIRFLQPSTNYYFRIVAQNAIGTSSSPIQSFKTGSISLLSGGVSQTPDNSDVALRINTKGVLDLSSDSATLLGSATPSAINDTTAYFRYSEMPVPPVFCNDIYGSNMISTPDIKLGVGGGEQFLVTNISGLQPDTTHYYCPTAS